MTEEEFRARFNADRRADRMTQVFGNNTSGLALGLKGNVIMALDHRGPCEIPLADAAFIDREL